MSMDKETARKTIFHSTYNALLLLVESCGTSQGLAMQDGRLKNLPETARYKEYCTVRMGTSRQAGHSTAVTNLAVGLFDSVLFLTPNQVMSHYLHKKVIEACSVSNPELSQSAIATGAVSKVETKNGLYLFSQLSTQPSNLLMYKYEAIVVDNASFMKPSQEEKIYRELSSGMNENSLKFFIFIQ